MAFPGFMSVVWIPSFLKVHNFISHILCLYDHGSQEQAVFVHECANGLYGPGAYIFTNTIVVVPFLFTCTLLSSVISWVYTILSQQNFD